MIIFRFLMWVINKYLQRTVVYSVGMLFAFPILVSFLAFVEILAGRTADSINWIAIPLSGVLAATSGFLGGMTCAIFIEFIALIWHKIKVRILSSK